MNMKVANNSFGGLRSKWNKSLHRHIWANSCAHRANSNLNRPLFELAYTVTSFEENIGYCIWFELGVVDSWWFQLCLLVGTSSAWKPQTKLKLNSWIPCIGFHMVPWLMAMKQGRCGARPVRNCVWWSPHNPLPDLSLRQLSKWTALEPPELLIPLRFRPADGWLGGCQSFSRCWRAATWQEQRRLSRPRHGERAATWNRRPCCRHYCRHVRYAKWSGHDLH